MKLCGEQFRIGRIDSDIVWRTADFDFFNLFWFRSFFCGSNESDRNMSAFTESALIKKLVDLNQSQQSIQTLSLWLIHHRKHHSHITKSWYNEMRKGEFPLPKFLVLILYSHVDGVDTLKTTITFYNCYLIVYA